MYNGCVEALSSMRRDAEVAPKCLLRSLVIRKKKMVWKGHSRPKIEKEKEEAGKEGTVGKVIMVGCITT